MRSATLVWRYHCSLRRSGLSCTVYQRAHDHSDDQSESTPHLTSGAVPRMFPLGVNLHEGPAHILDLFFDVASIVEEVAH